MEVGWERNQALLDLPENVGGGLGKEDVGGEGLRRENVGGEH